MAVTANGTEKDYEKGGGRDGCGRVIGMKENQNSAIYGANPAITVQGNQDEETIDNLLQR